MPLLKKRLELSREEAHKLWNEKRKEGWQPTKAQWRPPQAPFWSKNRHLPATQGANGSSA